MENQPTTWEFALERQLKASIDSLENAIRACPADLWGDSSQHIQFWYTVYHTLFWLDLYLSGSAEGFAPPPPFDLGELDPVGVLPGRIYTTDELLAYLAYCRDKCSSVAASLAETAPHICTFPWGKIAFAELLLYTLRHTQGHAGELNLLLGQTTGAAPGWVSGLRSRR